MFFLCTFAMVLRFSKNIRYCCLKFEENARGIGTYLAFKTPVLMAKKEEFYSVYRERLAYGFNFQVDKATYTSRIGLQTNHKALQLQRKNKLQPCTNFLNVKNKAIQ